MKKSKIVWIIVWCLLAILTIGNLFLLKIVPEMKYVLIVLIVAWGILLTIRQVIAYKDLRIELKKKMPVFLAELCNAGVISPSQCLDPQKAETDMFFSEYKKEFLKRKFLIALVIFICINIIFYLV
ncbi:MAG: hypothetical protein RR400_01930 [Clostridia bacterium]